MNIKPILENVLCYYSRNRGVGHTSIMQKGLSAAKSPFVVVISQRHAKDCADGALSLCLERPETWRGIRAPIAWDNYTIETLVAESLRTIYNLEDENKCIPELQQEIEVLRKEMVELKKPTSLFVTIFNRIANFFRR